MLLMRPLAILPRAKASVVVLLATCECVSVYDQQYESEKMFHRATVNWIGAWPWNSPVVRASVTSGKGRAVHQFTPALNESEDDLAARIASELVQLRLPH